MSTVTRREPIFNAPTAVVALVGLLVAVHVLRQFVSQSVDERIVYTLAFIPARLTHDVQDLPGGLLVRLGQLVTHTVLHGDWLHLTFNGLWLLATGTIAARRLGWVRMIALALASAAAGALLFWALNTYPNAAMLGASGGISGLLGAATRLMHAAQEAGNMGLLRERSRELVIPSLWTALADRQVLVSTIVFIGLNIAIAFGLGAELSASGIAWQAHVGGYLFGLIAYGLFDPGPRPANDAGTTLA